MITLPRTHPSQSHKVQSNTRIRDFGPPRIPVAPPRGGYDWLGVPGVVQRRSCTVTFAGQRQLSGPAPPATRSRCGCDVTMKIRDFGLPPQPRSPPRGGLQRVGGAGGATHRVAAAHRVAGGAGPKREEPGKTDAPCVKVPGSSRVPSHSTCPPLSSPPHANNFVNRSCSNKTHTNTPPREHLCNRS